MLRKVRFGVVVVVGAAVLLAGCGGGDDPFKRDKQIISDLQSVTQDITSGGSFQQAGAVRNGFEVLADVIK